VTIRAVHLVPQSLAGKRVFAQKKRAKLLLHDDSRALLDGAIETLDSAGGYAHIDRAGMYFFRTGGLVLVGGGPQIVVYIQRIYLRLRIDTCLLRIPAMQLDQFHGFNLQRASGIRRRGHESRGKRPGATRRNGGRGRSQ
jgi:hypothetical protein